tara:strand:+ start:86 stop:256 length:171 start_codon:yes stop_codon:yes gene_type:complete
LAQANYQLKQTASVIQIALSLLPLSNSVSFLVTNSLATADQKLLINAVAINAKQAA